MAHTRKTPALKASARKTLAKAALAAAILAGAAAPAIAQPGIVTSIDPGYSVTEIPLPPGGTYAGTIGHHATDPGKLLFTYDNGAGITLATLDLDSLAIADLFTDTAGIYFGFPGGIAAIDDQTVVVVDNGANTVYLFQDADMSGDFDETEITTLDALGLDISDPTGNVGDFTGSKVRVVRAGDVANLPTGSFIIQTADSPDPSEVFVVGPPLSAPVFIPDPGATNEAYFRGTGDLAMVFDGGLGFGPLGTLIIGVSLLSDARIIAVRDLDGDGRIDQGTEANLLFEGTISGIGMYDLSATTAGELVAVSGGGIWRAEIPGTDPLASGPITAWTPIVSTSSFFLAGGILNDSTLPFAPGGDPASSAAFVFGDFVGTELYLVRPSGAASVSDWTVLD